MSRLINVLFALVLLAALVIAVSPEARQQAAEAVEDVEPTLKELDDRVIIYLPSFDLSEQISTPTPIADEGDNVVQIPVTGEEDSSDEPFIVINWDAIGDALKNFWERLRSVEVDLTPAENP